MDAINATNDLMISLNTNSMNEMRSGLTEIRDYLIGFNTTKSQRNAELLIVLIGRLDEVNSSIDNHLDQVETSLNVLTQLDTIIDDIESVDKNLDATGNDIESKESAIQVTNINLLILLLIVIGLQVFIIVKGMKKPNEDEETLSWDDKRRK